MENEKTKDKREKFDSSAAEAEVVKAAEAEAGEVVNAAEAEAGEVVNAAEAEAGKIGKVM